MWLLLPQLQLVAHSFGHELAAAKMSRLVEHVASADADAQFEFGLDVWLRGMRGLLTQNEKGES